jgi:hypothetical protein
MRGAEQVSRLLLISLSNRRIGKDGREYRNKKMSGHWAEKLTVKASSWIPHKSIRAFYFKIQGVINCCAVNNRYLKIQSNIKSLFDGDWPRDILHKSCRDSIYGHVRIKRTSDQETSHDSSVIFICMHELSLSLSRLLPSSSIVL